MKTKPDPRHQARRIALAALFGWSHLSQDLDRLTQTAAEELLEGGQVDEDLLNLISDGVVQNLDTIDQIIKASAPEWPLEQIARVDLTALRIAIFELYIAQNVPPKVAIDEAIELAKEFGGETSGKFVNGVLGTVVKTLTPQGK